MKIKFLKDRSPFKKDQVIEVSDEVGLQLLNTGEGGSCEEADSNAKTTSRTVINAGIKKAQKAKAEKLKEKLKEVTE